MRTDPKVRKDGRCAQCRKQMPTVTAAMRKYSGDQIDRDPFCSMACCRKWHGCELPSGELRASSRPALARDYAMENRQRRERLKEQRELPPGHRFSAANYRNGCRCDGCRGEFVVWQREKRRMKAAA